MSERARLYAALRAMQVGHELAWGIAHVRRSATHLYRVDLAERPMSLDAAVAFLNPDDAPLAGAARTVFR